MRQIDEQLLTDVIDKHDILNQSRLRQYVWKRSAFCTFLRKHGYTFARIGQMLEKDHATIIHALKIYDNNKRYADFKACVSLLKYVPLAITIVNIAEKKTFIQDP